MCLGWRKGRFDRFSDFLDEIGFILIDKRLKALEDSVGDIDVGECGVQEVGVIVAVGGSGRDFGGERFEVFGDVPIVVLHRGDLLSDSGEFWVHRGPRVRCVTKVNHKIDIEIRERKLNTSTH